MRKLFFGRVWLRQRKWPLVAGMVLLGTMAGFLFGLRARLERRVRPDSSPPATPGRERATDEPNPVATPGGERAPGARNPAPPLPSLAPEVTTEGLKEEFAATGRNLIARYPDSPDAYAVMAWIEFNLGRSAAAEKSWRKCLEVSPRFAWAWHGMGNIAAQKGDFEEAATCFRKALALDPSMTEAGGFLADALMNLGRLEEAKEVIEKNILKEPGVAGNYYLLGQTCLQLHQFEKAKEGFERAIAIYPGYTHAYYGLSAACTRLGEKEKARQYQEEFQRRRAKDFEKGQNRVRSIDDPSKWRLFVLRIYRTAAENYERHGDLGEAEKLWRKSLGLNPKDSKCRQALANIYRAQGRNAEAIQILGSGARDGGLGTGD
jgi:tetratricopeptide (TPR) repeat protein